MMSTITDFSATTFAYAHQRRDSYFESILEVCIAVYRLIISSTKVQNDENKIRDEFIKHLQNINFKKQYELKNLKFDPETKENSGRADIRVLPTKDEYIDDEEYYLIECKRLNSSNLTGKRGLNAEYIKNGICRFVSTYYSTYYDCNAMFGFLVEKVDVQNDIVDKINNIINKDYINAQKKKVNARATTKLHYRNFANGYNHSYISTHTRNDGKNITLYHLMFDFSNNMI